jgi:hypothetical protein
MSPAVTPAASYGLRAGARSSGAVCRETFHRRARVGLVTTGLWFRKRGEDS